MHIKQMCVNKINRGTVLKVDMCCGSILSLI